jgi:predicted nucleic acid-binding Zn ribbon protein
MDHSKSSSRLEVTRALAGLGKDRPRSRAFAPRGDLTAVRTILEKVLNRRGLGERVQRYEFMQHWDKIVGGALAAVCKPEYLSNKTLVVRVLNSGWAQELAFLKPIVIQKVCGYLPKGKGIEDVVFRVGPL